MNHSIRNLSILFVFLSTVKLHAANGETSYCQLEENQEINCIDEQACLREEKLRNLKEVLNNAIEKKDVRTLTAIYMVTREKQYLKTSCAIISGTSALYFTAFSPLLFGATLIPAVPMATYCIYSFIKAHKVRKVKQKAKVALNRLLPSEIYEKIIAMRSEEDLKKLEEFL